MSKENAPKLVDEGVQRNVDDVLPEDIHGHLVDNPETTEEQSPESPSSKDEESPEQ